MDVDRILAQLREEKEQIEQAVLALERLVRSRTHKRSPLPASLSSSTEPAIMTPRKRGRPRGSKNKPKDPQ